MTLDSTPNSPTSFNPPVQTSSLAIISLVSGFASWFLLPVLGAIIAVITGHLAKKEIRESDGRLSGVEMANAGLVLGYIHLALTIVGICLVMILVAGLIAFVFGSIQLGNTNIRIVP
jgi:phosphate/sulfate permease